MSGSHILQHKNIKLQAPTRGAHIRKDNEIRPSDVLIDRNQQLKHITKSLISFYESKAHIESVTAKANLASMETIQVPFHEGHNFLGDGGWQSSLYAVRDQTKVIADHHSTLATTIETTVVVELQAVRTALKAQISALHKEAGALADEVEKEREVSAGHLTQLQAGIDTFENSATHMLPQHDPYIVHIQVAKQLEKQVHAENALQQAIIRFQQQQPEFESGIITSIKSACGLYDAAFKTTTAQIAIADKIISEELQRVHPLAEYEHFAAKDVSKIDPNTELRSVTAIAFPGLSHPSTIPIREGQLERKKRYTKSYQESFYVLTPSGFLQERKSKDESSTGSIVPTFSLFLPECTLGPPAKESDKSHKFHLEGNKAHKSTFESKVKAGFKFGGHEHAYSFRARTHQELLLWWNEIDKLTKDTKIAVAPELKAGNPISFAVANVGRPLPVSTPISPSQSVAASTTVEAREAAQAEESDDAGGSSEEEELAEEARQVKITSGSALTEEGLPVYAGDGTTLAEKSALHEKGTAPVLGAVVGEKGAEGGEGEPSTSKGWFA